jgi:CRP-like cAMP-binding protein
VNPAELFAREPNPIRLSPGEALFQAGEPGDGMYVVLEGALEVVIGDRILERPNRGSIIGEMALIDQSPRSATVVAREPSLLAKLDTKRFQHVIQQNPFFATHVMKVLVDRIRRIDHERSTKP